MLNDNLFYRNIPEFKSLKYSHIVAKLWGDKDILALSRHKIKKGFKIHYEHEFLCYRMNKLRAWINLHERYENDYLEKLKDFINLLYLDQELNSYELNYIKHFENIIFAKKRNLKNLIVDFPLSHKKEKVYYKYDAVSFCHTTVKKQMVHTIENGEFFISTKRVLFSKDTNIFAIDIQTIKDFKVSDTDLQIQTESDTFIFKTNDPYLLYVSLQRILKLLSILI